MAAKFMKIALTAGVQGTQDRYYGRHQTMADAPERDVLGVEEAAFIEARDSFYVATVNADGWPYIQHRGGPPGFLKVIGPNQLGFADYSGNRQLLSTGNLAGDDRLSLFLMDYAAQERLKLLGRGRIVPATDAPELVLQLTAGLNGIGRVERVFLIDVVAFDWNCQQFITPRYTEAEIQVAIEPLRARITELERAPGPSAG